MDVSGGDVAGGGHPRRPLFSSASRPLMEFVAVRSAEDLSLAARCIQAGDFHLAIRSVRRVAQLVDFATSMAALGREFPEDEPRTAADGFRTPEDNGAAKVLSIVGGNRRAAGTVDAQPQGLGPPTGRETKLLGQLRQVAAEIWEAFGSAVESAGVTSWERFGHLSERQAPVAPNEGRLTEAVEIYRALVELNAAVLRWERFHFCDRSLGSNRWCAASGTGPLFAGLPPAPGITAPRAHRGATTW